MHIQIFTTGGTIDKIYFDKKSLYEVGEPQVGRILEEATVDLSYTIRSLMKKDSLDLTHEDREKIRTAVESCRYDHILITHGTDTMVETALTLEGIDPKLVVLTGALEPARSKWSDAPFNVGSAVAALQCLPAGVYIVMNGRVYDPRKVRKNFEKNRFEEIPPETVT